MESFLRGHQWLSYLRDSPSFIEKEGALDCTQDDTTASYPKPYEPSAHPTNLYHYGSIYYYPSIDVFVFQIVSSLEVIRQQFCMNLSSLQGVLHVLPISTFLISLSLQQLGPTKNNYVPYHAVIANLLRTGGESALSELCLIFNQLDFRNLLQKGFIN